MLRQIIVVLLCAGFLATLACGSKEGREPKQSGVYVNDVVPGGQAEKLEIRINDRIVEYDGKPIQSVQQLAKLAQNSRGRSRVGVVLERKGQLVEIEAKGGVLGIICGDRIAETMGMLKQAEEVSSESPLHEFLNQYLSWFRHPGAKSIEPQAIASDAISTWSDGRVLRGREEHIRAMKQMVEEIREAFQSFEATAHDITFELDGGMGWISCRLHREGILKKSGGKFSRDGRTTLKLKRNGDIWQLVEELSTLDKP